MKRFVLGFFVFAFVFNTISLSAYASSCPHGLMKSEKKTEAAPSCHQAAGAQQKGAKDSQAPSKVGHCKGLCFCQHASLGQNVAPFGFVEALGSPLALKSLAVLSGAQDYLSAPLFPLERPPKTIS